MKGASRHIQHYLPLVGILIAGIVGFWFFSYDKNFLVALSIAIASGYVTWGIVHHYIHKDLHTSVIIEYLVIAVLGLVIVLSIIFRA